MFKNVHTFTKENGCRQLLKSKYFINISKKNKLHRDWKYTWNLDPVCCCVYFKFLNVDDQKIAAGRHGIIKGTGQLNEFTYFKDALTLKWK